MLHGNFWVGLLRKCVVRLELLYQFREKLDGLPSILGTLWVSSQEETLQGFVFSTEVGDFLEGVLVGFLAFLHLVLHLTHADLHGVDGLLEVLNCLLVGHLSIAVKECHEREDAQDHNGHDLKSS